MRTATVSKSLTGSVDSANTGPRVTAQAGATPGGTDSCISGWGAEDMIGNLWKWTADWFSAGNTWMTSDSQSANPWPVGYGDDITYNVNGRPRTGTGYTSGLPAAASGCRLPAPSLNRRSQASLTSSRSFSSSASTAWSLVCLRCALLAAMSPVRTFSAVSSSRRPSRYCWLLGKERTAGKSSSARS